MTTDLCQQTDVPLALRPSILLHVACRPQIGPPFPSPLDNRTELYTYYSILPFTLTRVRLVVSESGSTGHVLGHECSPRSLQGSAIFGKA